MFLDYSVDTDEGRLAVVRAICDGGGRLSSRDKEAMADYLLRVGERGSTGREHSNEYPVTTRNRDVTHSARNVSLDGFGDAAELFADQPFAVSGPVTPALDPITVDDVAKVPGLAENRVLEAKLREAVGSASGDRRRMLRAQLIEVRREAYYLRSLYRGTDPSRMSARVVRDVARLRLDGEVRMGEDGYPVDGSPVSLFDPAHVSYLLQWYLQLKNEVRSDLDSDMHWLLVDFAALVRRTLPPHTLLHDLAAMRALGYPLKDISEAMTRLHGVTKTQSQWRYILAHTVSNAIARQAQTEWVEWYYGNVAYGEWKRCGRCRRWKPVHPLFWSRDGGRLYSICKQCRRVRSDEPGTVHLRRRSVRNG